MKLLPSMALLHHMPPAHINDLNFIAGPQCGLDEDQGRSYYASQRHVGVRLLSDGVWVGSRRCCCALSVVDVGPERGDEIYDEPGDFMALDDEV